MANYCSYIPKEADTVICKDNDLLNEVIQKISDNINQKLEDEIVKRLNDAGYFFGSDIDKVSFAKERCIITKFEGLSTLYVDLNIPICCWYDNFEFNYTGSKITASFNMSK